MKQIGFWLKKINQISQKETKHPTEFRFLLKARILVWVSGILNLLGPGGPIGRGSLSETWCAPLPDGQRQARVPTAVTSAALPGACGVPWPRSLRCARSRPFITSRLRIILGLIKLANAITI